MRAAAVIVAAGFGRRAGGDTPKQFREIAGRRVIDWSVDYFKSDDRFGQIALVVSEDMLDWGCKSYPALRLVSGGDTRAASVRAGLLALEAEPRTAVFIHDAARPGLSRAIIDRLFEALETAEAVAPGLPVYDALKRRTGRHLISVSREDLYRVQTPQVFRFEQILEAHQAGFEAAVDDLEVVERLGVTAALCQGSERLSKITTPADFARVERLLLDEIE